MATTAVTKSQKKALTFNDLLERMKPQIAAIMPKHLTAERMVALAALAATKTPKLKECTPLSLFNSVMYASRLGLEIGQHAHLVPFGNECVMIPDYRGLIGLAVRSGKVRHIDARAVYVEDDFDYGLGDTPFIRHKPKLGSKKRQPADLVAVYTVTYLADGTKVIGTPMSKDEVDAVRGRSRAKDNGPWVTDYVPMALKTVVKRDCKFLPQTPELAAAIELDNRGETGEISTVSDIIDTSESVNDQVAAQTKQKAEELKASLAEPKGATAEGRAEPSEQEPPAGAEPAEPPAAAPSAPTKAKDGEQMMF